MRPLSLCLMLSALAGSLAAQSQQPPPDCKGAEHRQFDFWVGDWVVTSRGTPAGTNSITLEEGGCILHEHWSGAQGGSGQSFNFYDRGDGKWHQIWIDNTGMVLRLSGRYADGKLSYAGETHRRNGTRILQRLVFTRNADGSVRQLWESSGDEGKTWSVVFDGLYRKR